MIGEYVTDPSEELSRKYLYHKVQYLNDRVEELIKQDHDRWSEIHALADYLNLKIEKLPERYGVSKKRRYFK